MDPDWLSFPDEVWESILDYFDVKNLLAVALTCSKLNNLILETPRIIKKLTLYIDENQKDRNHSDDEEDDEKLVILNQARLVNSQIVISSVLKSKRQYKNIVVSHPFRNIETRKQVIEILNLFSKSVQQLTFMVDDSFTKKEIIEILKPCDDLRKCTFDFMYFDEQDDDEFESPRLPRMEEVAIIIEEPKLYGVLSCCDKLKKLYVSETHSQTDNAGNGHLLEEFLVKQHHLADLTIIKEEKYTMFSTKLLSQCNFNLQRLVLKGEISFADSDNALEFFQTQTQLKDVEIHFDPDWNGNLTTKDILKHIFMNKDLQKLSVTSTDYIMKNFDFLFYVINEKVESLKCESQFITAFAKIFPNVKCLNYVGLDTEDNNVHMINEFKHLKILEIENLNVESMNHIHVTSKKFKSFIYSSFLKRFDFESFLKHHPYIRNLYLPFIIKYEEAKKISEYCPHLETFTVLHFETDIELSIQYLCLNLKNLKSIEIISYYIPKVTPEITAFCKASAVTVYKNDYY